MIGQILDKYEVLEKVGEGGMASVYRGRHLTLSRDVAIKVLHPHLMGQERNRLRFEREAKAIESLKHPNIVRIFDFSGADSEHVYIITEFINGLTLKAVLESRPLPSELAAIIGRELCVALEYAHHHGIVHRDIKPENVMICANGQVKLMDFGIARVVDDSKVTITGGLVGSPAYMSPEQATDGDISHPSDLFSLGILLYRAVTGHLPFMGSSPPIILRNIIDGNYPAPEEMVPSMDPNLGDVIRQALEKRPEDRYPSAKAMGQALTRTLLATQYPAQVQELADYLRDPIAYDETVKAHLCLTLLPAAKTLMAEEPAQALRLLNRLLFLDEDNEEVLGLLSSLHELPPPEKKPYLGLALAAAIPLAAIFLLLYQSGWLAFDEPAYNASGQLNRALPTEAQVVEIESSPTPALDTPPSTPGAPGPSGDGNANPDGNGGQATATAAPKSPASTPPKRPRRPKSKANTPPVRKKRGSDTQKEATPKAIKAPQPGILDIRSQPWADIYLAKEGEGNDGKNYGSTLRADPISLAPGKYTIRLLNPNCAAREATIEIASGQITRRNYSLCARLQLEGLKDGDSVSLDKNDLGLAQNLKMPIVLTYPPESHFLEIDRADGTQFSKVLNDIAHHKTVVVQVPSDGQK